MSTLIHGLSRTKNINQGTFKIFTFVSYGFCVWGKSRGGLNAPDKC